MIVLIYTHSKDRQTLADGPPELVPAAFFNSRAPHCWPITLKQNSH